MKEWIQRHRLKEALLGGLLAACQLSLFASPSQRYEDLQLEARQGDTLVVENDYGRVRVNAWDQPMIEVTIRKIANDEASLEKIYVLSQRASSKIFLRAFFYEYQSESLYLDIQTPAFLNVVVWGINPAVEIEGLRGKVKVHTITGFITARDLLSASSLATDEGNIQYLSHQQPAGDIHLESVRGHITCSVAGKLNLRGWLRAGKTLNWNDELVLSPGALERQVGIGGPLILAASSEGNVSFILEDRVEATGFDDLRHDQPTENSQLQEATREDSSFEEPQFASHEDSPHPDQTQVLTPSKVGGGYALKVAVDWIYVNASVRDRYTNRAVPNLVQEDFQVYEEGSLQQIERFDSTEAPFSLLLLLDVSGSTKSYLNLIKDASIQFTEEIKTNDRIAVATFNSTTRLVHDFTNNRTSIRNAIARIRSGGGTAFYDALDRSVSEYLDGVEGRKAIVVFTDGVDNQLTGDFGSGSRITFSDLYRQVQEADTLIYSIFLDTEDQYPNRPGGLRRGGLGGILADIIFKGPAIGIPGGGPGQDESYAQARRELELIADQTGGRMYAPRSTQDLTYVYSEIANDLRVQYTLGYHSQNAANNGKWRNIEVKISNRPDLAVRARKGYYGRRT